MPAADPSTFGQVVRVDDPNQHASLLKRVTGWLRIGTVIDVGGHVGEFGQLMRQEVGYVGPMVSFEPDPQSARALRARTASDASWHLHQLALSDRTGRQPLHRFDRSNFNSLLPGSDSLQEWFEVTPLDDDMVNVVRLDDWLDTAAVAVSAPLFLKVDTQGSDWSVIEGAERRWSDIAAIQLELSVLPLYEHVPHWTDTITRLEDMGFWPAGLFPVTRDPGLLRVTEFDGVFTRDL